jgi:hypothetical protein
MALTFPMNFSAASCRADFTRRLRSTTQFVDRTTLGCAHVAAPNLLAITTASRIGTGYVDLSPQHSVGKGIVLVQVCVALLWIVVAVQRVHGGIVKRR